MPSEDREDRAERFTWKPGDLQVIHTPFEYIFKTGHSSRDRYLSRLFGLFSESVVRDWSKGPDAPFHDLGRPTLYDRDEKRGYTLDFALKRGNTRDVYVVEMKCELEYDGYKYLRLERDTQIDHHRSIAFTRFLELSRDHARFTVRVDGKETRIAGTILVWGAMTVAGRAAAMARFGISDVLSIEDMLRDLRGWGDQTPWPGRMKELRDWSNELFDALVEHPAF